MMTYTTYDPNQLEQWRADAHSSELFEELLTDYTKLYHDCFCSKIQRLYFSVFIKGLFSSLDRKSLEPIALHLLGEKSVRSMQRLLNRAPLKDEQLLHTYQKLLASRLSSKGGMLSVDDSSFVKKGTHSIGVKRQYCGCLGKTENCQIGVFMACAGTSGYGLIDRELYIPKQWYEPSHESLRNECHLPSDQLFLTKN